MSARKPVAERLWPKVEKLSANECWLWKGAKNNNGYGQINSGGRGRIVLAHRVMWEITKGQIPTGMCVLHRCDNPLCCNPRHLFLGTQPENVADMDTKGRRINSPHLGEKNGHSRLTEPDIVKIRKLHADGVKQLKIARMFDLYQGSVSNIVLRKSWAHVP